MLECVPNVSEGRDNTTLRALATVCGSSLLDVHTDPDHHRSVLTLAGPGARDVERVVRALASAVAERVDIAGHSGVHPRLGALDVVPFVALDPSFRPDAVEAARAFARWIGEKLLVPAFFYDDADPEHRSLPDVRRDAFSARAPDFGPSTPHPRLGAVAVAARPPLVALNCTLDRDDLPLARAIAHRIRERDHGLPGVRALGLRLPAARSVQVSVNLVALERTGLEQVCTTIRADARRAGADVERVELVGLVPAAELARCTTDFVAWAGLGADHTIEARLGRAPE